MLKSACTVLTAVGVVMALAPTAHARARLRSKDPACTALAVSAGRAPAWFAERCLGGAPATQAKAPAEPRVPGDIAYYTNTFYTAIAKAPLQTLTFTPVGPTSNFFFAMAFNNAATTLYGVDDTSHQLGTIDLTTGAFTPIGVVPVPVGQTVTGMTFDRTSSNVYFTSTDGATADLFTIDITTGALTLVGPITGFAFTIDIAIDNSGQMYGHDIGADALIRIDKATGAPTLVGPTGLAANFAQGMMQDPSDDTLYGCVYVGSAELVSFNKTTGAATVLAGPIADEIECAAKVASGPPAPFLAYQSSVVDDSVTGNNNGHIDSNECLNLNVTLHNGGALGATGISATLSTTTTGVTVSTATSAYPNIAAGANGTNTTPFQFSTSASFVIGTRINFSLAITTAQGPFTATFSVPTGGLGTPVDFLYTGPPVPIPDANPTGAFINIAASGVASVGKATFTVYINHTWDSDLALTLAGPGGTPVDALSTNNGGSGDNYGTDCPADANDTTFDDAAATPITAGTAPFVGSFRPQSPLSVFTGLSGNGTWQFKVVDNAGADTGNINCAKLSLTPLVDTPGPGACGPLTGKFYTLTPCRVADTRNPPGPSGGPALAANTTRSFPVKGICGVPTDATSVAISLTVVQETDTGDLRLYPQGATVPLASTINFAVNHVRANNAIIPLGAGPTNGISVQCDMPTGSTGTTHFLFDVFGYFK